MMVSVTNAEYEAIMFCREQVTSAVEAASDDSYIKQASEACDGVASFRRKYLKEAAKQRNLSTAKKAVRKLHPELEGKFFDKLVRIVAKELNKNEI